MVVLLPHVRKFEPIWEALPETSFGLKVTCQYLQAYHNKARDSYSKSQRSSSLSLRSTENNKEHNSVKNLC